MDRRQFLRSGGAVGAMVCVAFAGCQGDSGRGNGGGSRTREKTARTTRTTRTGRATTEEASGIATGAVEEVPYAEWVYRDAYRGGDAIGALSLRLSAMQGDNEDRNRTDMDDLPDDLLLEMTAAYLLGASFAIGFSLGSTPIGDTLSESGGADTGIAASRGTILEGTFDAAALGTTLADSGATDLGTESGYTLWGTPGRGNRVVALSETSIVSANEGDGVDDPEAHVRTLIDIGVGDITPYVRTDRPFASLVGTLPPRDLMGVQYLPDGDILDGQRSDGKSRTPTRSDIGLDGVVRGIALSTAFDQRREALRSAIAIRYADAAEVDDRATIRSAAGTVASDQSVSIRGNTAVVEGVYDESSLSDGGENGR